MKAFAAVIFALTFGTISLSTGSGPRVSGSPEVSMEFTISSPSFTNGGDISNRFTCDGLDVSPQLSWSNAPKETVSFALLANDPDAPAGNWNHWAMWNIPATSHGLPEGVQKNSRLTDGSVQGTNDFRKIGYNGPCPPAGKPHRYYFKLYALDKQLEVSGDSGKKELEAAMKGHIRAQTECMGKYQRTPK